MTSLKRMLCIPIVKLNYLNLVVHTVFDRCQELMYFPRLCKIFPGTLLNLLQCPGYLCSLSGNQKANQPSQIRLLFYDTVSQKYELDMIDKSE